MKKDHGPRALKPFALILGIGAVIALSWILPVREWSIALADRLRGAGTRGVVLFIATYVLAEVALVPGSLLTMAAGFAYGPVKGLLVASPASMLAATVAFLLGRTVLRDWVRQKIAASPKARTFKAVIGQNSFNLILLLRLSPVIPFNLLNYALGVSDVRVSRYVAASLVGMLPGTWMYVYLGSLADTAAGLTEASRRGSSPRLALTVAGLIATILLVVFVTRSARRALDAELRTGQSQNR